MKAARQNFKFFSHFTYYVPGVADIFIILLWLLVGALLGNVATLAFTFAGSAEIATEYAMLVSYPVMFIPAMLYASIKSRNASFNRNGVKLDSENFSPVGGALCAVLAAVSMLCMAIMSDALISLLPQMPKWIEDALKSMTEGKVWVDLICVSVMAPICEEWLCRGMVLRGLLHNGIRPGWAIVISAAFFAIIHLNPWQALPAFLLGCMMGYVYYKTGSLKLTMLMHFTNNTFAVICSHIPGLEDCDSWMDILPGIRYWVLFAGCALLLILIIRKFITIPLNSKEGNSDKVKSVFEEE